jgi:2-polyprenyl-6-hydroxyphenyl methylase/3-demethylubiquinone-9 3-methyltransferase
MNSQTTIDPQEIQKFAQYSQQWWDCNGPLKTLHDINPIRLDYILKHTSLVDKRVLDIGCGGGILSESMAKMGAVVTGLDAEVEAISTAQHHATEQGLSVQYVCESVEQHLLEKPESYDVITCMEMLEHVACPQQIIHHAARLLKPGGFLFLSTLNRTMKAYATAIIAAEYVFNLLPRQTHDYDKFIKPSELSSMIRAEELEVQSIEGMGYNPFTNKASLQSSVTVNYLLAAGKLPT